MKPFHSNSLFINSKLIRNLVHLVCKCGCFYAEENSLLAYLAEKWILDMVQCKSSSNSVMNSRVNLTASTQGMLVN